MPDSRILALHGLQRRSQALLVDAVISGLRTRGHDRITPTQLAFLGELDCGPNHASEIARRLSISRQAVHRQVLELERLGVLTQQPGSGRGNARVIVFTADGEKLMSDARLVLQYLDQRLSETLGEAALSALVERHAALAAALEGLDQTA